MTTVSEPMPPGAGIRTPPSGWSAFRRHDLGALVAAVRDLARARDPGTYGQGVDVVIESPPLHWWQRVRDRRPRDQARIAVTGDGGTTGYPVHVRLATGIGAGAVRRVDRRDGWATSVTTVAPSARKRVPDVHPVDGEAILLLKRGTRPGYDPADAATEVVAGSVAALDDLHPFSPARGWRFTIDRDVRRG